MNTRSDTPADARREALYTETTKCQDCYKCVRECPVKSIQVKENSARVVGELCIACGHCVDVCPARAKKVRNDLPEVKQLLQSGRRTVVSLAPSFVTAFPTASPRQLVAGLRRLGFAGVIETALGAEAISRECAAILARDPRKLWISSACPAIVDLICKYYPRAARHLMAVASPMVASARIARTHLGPDTNVVFIGPCVAKKREADAPESSVDATLTFEDLGAWFARSGITLRQLEPETDDDFLVGRAKDAVLYPVDGGMIESIRAVWPTEGEDARLSFSKAICISGMREIRSALTWMESLPPNDPGESGFFELLACAGGCINGPCMGLERRPGVQRRFEVVSYRDEATREVTAPTIPDIDISRTYSSSTPMRNRFTDEDIQNALHRAGKDCKEDELNCGGCGYDSCRSFALALLEGKAEVAMCLSYMRKLASKKAHALIHAMPSGVVIADQNLRIVEANAKFSQMIGGDLLIVAEAHPGLEDIQLRKVISFGDLFSDVLYNKREKVDQLIHHDGRVLQVLVFPIEKGRLVGGILQDITEPAVQREQIVEKAREVIYKNLKTVQKIAYLLGENAAESEVILSSIIDVYSVPK